MNIKRIVVGTDGSTNASLALRWAIDLALAVDAEVVAVHSMGLLLHPHPGETIPSYGHGDDIRKEFENVWCEPLHNSGVRNQSVFLEGNPVSGLLQTSTNMDADLIVVGSRGHGGFPELRLGSTSHQLLEHTERPVVVIPSDWESAN
ncbi:MAG: universal stress protein [Acidimicrobiales bacterium]